MKNIKSFKEKISYWDLTSKIDKAIESNIKEVKYEGTEVNRDGIRDSILEIIYEICPEYKPEGYGEPWRGY